MLSTKITNSISRFNQEKKTTWHDRSRQYDLANARDFLSLSGFFFFLFACLFFLGDIYILSAMKAEILHTFSSMLTLFSY